MNEFIDHVIVEPFVDVVERVQKFLPNLLTSVFLLLVGLVAAWLLRAVITRSLRLIKIDGLLERSGVTMALRKGGITDPVSRLAGKLFYWITLLGFVIIALDALYIPAIKSLLASFFLYLPNFFVAVIIIIAGYAFGNFVSRAALIAAVNAGIRVSGLIGRLIKVTVFLLALTMALEMLGIGKETALVAFTIIFGGIILALSIAFGIGGRELAKRYLEETFGQKKEEEQKDDFKHI